VKEPGLLTAPVLFHARKAFSEVHMQVHASPRSDAGRAPRRGLSE
jgi:hypothetical protein